MADASESGSTIVTVRGRIPSSDFGRVLAHEHIMCDFVGAESTAKERYDATRVVDTMRPRLEELVQRGFAGFVDCTPAYIGRDVKILADLSAQTGLHILTNTGYYGAAGDKFVPRHAFRESAAQLAERWFAEWEAGIDATAIQPGFIKIGVDPGPLSEIDRKLVVAAALLHLRTGLVIACHSGEQQAAREVLSTATDSGISGEALIVVHADGIADWQAHAAMLEKGAWLEYDGVSEQSVDRHVQLISKAVRQGYAHRLLLSQDAGWYRVGEPAGGAIRPFTALPDALLPGLSAAGIAEETIRVILEQNPQTAFGVKVRAG